MVCFTCNHCGESVQKPKVDKHYQTKCRTNKSLTCMDCFKDFQGEDYAVHNKCITEEQRYSAKGSVSDAPKKGEQKQMTWVAQINDILENSNDLKPNVKKLLEFISNHENVPRKKVKFINFMKSSSGNKVNLKDVEEVWDLLEAQKKKLTETSSKTSKNGTINESKPNEDMLQNGTETTINNVEKKKKKRKNSEGNVQNGEESESNKTGGENGVVEEEKSKKKSNKSKKESTEWTIAEVGEKKEEVETTESDVNTKKSKKKSKKNKNDLTKTEVEVVQEVTEQKTEVNGTDSTSTTEKSKKKSKKNKNNNVETKMEVDESNTNANGNNNQTKKSKKRKHQAETTETVKAPDTTTVEETNEEVPKKKKKNKAKDESKPDNNVKASLNGEFSWQDAISDVLKSGSLSKKELEKRVISQYKSFRSDGKEIDFKVKKNFNRKLKKMANVVVDNDVCSLK